jgi:hypothetical protein
MRAVEPEILRIGGTLEAMSPEQQSAALVQWLTKGSGTHRAIAMEVVRRAGLRQVHHRRGLEVVIWRASR